MHPVLIHFKGLLLLDQTRIDGAEVATTSYYVRIIIPSGWHRTKTLCAFEMDLITLPAKVRSATVELLYVFT